MLECRVGHTDNQRLDRRDTNTTDQVPQRLHAFRQQDRSGIRRYRQGQVAAAEQVPCCRDDPVAVVCADYLGYPLPGTDFQCVLAGDGLRNIRQPTGESEAAHDLLPPGFAAKQQVGGKIVHLLADDGPEGGPEQIPIVAAAEPRAEKLGNTLARPGACEQPGERADQLPRVQRGEDGAALVVAPEPVAQLSFGRQVFQELQIRQGGE